MSASRPGASGSTFTGSREDSDAAKVFTPAEDWLLLRGVVTFGRSGASQWKRMVQQLLPNKSEAALSARYRLLTDISAPDDTPFKSYVICHTSPHVTHFLTSASLTCSTWPQLP